MLGVLVWLAKGDTRAMIYWDGSGHVKMTSAPEGTFWCDSIDGILWIIAPLLKGLFERIDDGSL